MQLEAENAELRRQIEANRSELGAPGIREIEKKAKSSGMVTVACKIPMGLKLQLQHKQPIKIPSGRGGEYIVDEQYVFGGKEYYVFGPSMPAMGGVPSGYLLPQKLEGGFALTPNIPAAFWEQWLEQNRLADFVTSKMIFAYDDSSAVDAAQEHAELKSGLEPISPEVDAKGRLKDRRVPKPLNGAVGRVSYDEERAAQQKGAAADA